MFTLLHHICHYFSTYIKWIFLSLVFVSTLIFIFSTETKSHDVALTLLEVITILLPLPSQRGGIRHSVHLTTPVLQQQSSLVSVAVTAMSTLLWDCFLPMAPVLSYSVVSNSLLQISPAESDLCLEVVLSSVTQ